MTVLGISGSLRQQSLNTLLLNRCAEYKPDDSRFVIHPIGDVPLYNEDIDNTDDRPIPVVDLIRQIEAADAILFSSPEYNHGTSGVMKNALDWVSRPAFNSCLAGKPCGILTASKSPVGGARAQADLKKILSSTLSLVYPAVEYILPAAHTAFDSDGKLTDHLAAGRLKKYMEGFIGWAGGQTNSRI